MNTFEIQEVFPLKVGEKLITCIDLDLYCKMDVQVLDSKRMIYMKIKERKHDYLLVLSKGHISKEQV